MKERILTGWNLRRVFYSLIGLAFVVQAIILHEWVAAVAGCYFAAMGIFGFGCASGNCAVIDRGRYSSKTPDITEAKHEEIK
jgi:hypothetical protein